MPILSAENQFKKGLAALVDHNYTDAAVFFKRALDLDRARNRRQPDLRYLSYYGLSLARSGRSIREAIQICRTAVSQHRKQFLDHQSQNLPKHEISRAAYARRDAQGQGRSQPSLPAQTCSEESPPRRCRP